MEALMILRKAEPTWAEAKRQLNDPNFLAQLVMYPIENVNDAMLKKVDGYPWISQVVVYAVLITSQILFRSRL